MRVSVEAYGCTLNQGESRFMQELLEGAGHEVVEPDDAETSLVVTCCVIESTERRMLKRIAELKEKDKRVLIGGCMASIMKEKVSAVDPDAVFISPRNLEKVLDEVGEGDGKSPGEPADRVLPENSIDAIVPIGQGCTERCSYCVTRLARGALKSRPEEDITASVSRRLAEGFKEIRLTAQDTAAYGRDNDSSLPDLLNRITSLDGEFRIRIGMANITNLKPVLAETIRAFDSDKVYKFLHLPVQSGDDDLLRSMRRRYSVKDFIDICEDFRSKFPNPSISTDIITGFPGETQEQFQASLDLMKEVRPDSINVTRFSAREGTEAFNMDKKVPGWESKERSRELTRLRLGMSLEKKESLVGSAFRVMTTERLKPGTSMARTDSYRPVVLPGDLPLGSFYDVKIVSATDACLKAELA
ncbi:MAG: tRNA (N(6)-L-threonylcarbamoyladenosine(37)-C(2))-methylthiotransferase [Thermoplasmata archaeon]|nr:tRNA (N(6)-L-threonylcarbamoyladenosine(37)-C(2))-methylthiotransferase [Thermoplasmata archaeon]